MFAIYWSRLIENRFPAPDLVGGELEFSQLPSAKVGSILTEDGGDGGRVRHSD